MRMPWGAAAFGIMLLTACSETAAGTDAQPSEADAGGTETAEPGPPALDAILATDDAANCNFLTDAGRAMLLEDSFRFADEEEMEPVSNPSFEVAGIAVYPSVILPLPDDDRYTIYVGLAGSWLGLPVDAVSYKFLPRTDMPAAMRVHFEAPVETVAAALADAGYPVNRDGSMRRTALGEDGVMYDYYGLVSFVEPEGEGSVFECNEAGWDEGE
ncbi:MAG: hypothetical protein ACTS1X_01585 [Parasphingopyxis sp.]|uniref:hypothetical protein n=1 Tax=Parasphingopyxis sp. TaxID=1920299 RepID=UPI003FA154D4